MKKSIFILSLICGSFAAAQSYPPQDGMPGTTAVFKESPLFVGWATGIEVERGLLNKSNPNVAIAGNNKASAGLPENAIGFPNGDTVSLGDEGSATLTFAAPILNGDGFDLAVFENGGASYLELAFVEASSDSVHFFRFPAHSQTQFDTQIGSFGTPSATYLNNIAGKYSAQYGTPFDLSELPNDVLLNKNRITHVRVIDVVGSIDPLYATFDSFGNPVNESFPTPFASCGFDLQAVGVIHQEALGLNENFGNRISVYPNPAKDYVIVNSNTAVVVQIFDASGRKILEQQSFKGERIDTSGLLSGIYVIQISNGKNSQSQKLIIR